MKSIYTVLFACLFTHALSQDLSKLTVNIDVRSGAFKTNLPFDETFTIKGELGYTTKKVILKYGPADVKKEREYFTAPRNYGTRDKNNPVAEYTKEFIVKNGETEFTFSEVGPLRPNIPYKFTFLTLSQNKIVPNRLSFLREELNKKLAVSLLDKRVLGLQEMDDVYDELIAIASGYMNEEQFVDANSESFKIANYKKDLNLFSYRFLTLHNDISNAQSALVRILDSTGTNSLSQNIELLLPKLSALNAGSVPLSSFSKRALLTVIDQNYQDSRSIAQPLVYLQSFMSDKNQLQRIVLGDGTSALGDSLNTMNISTIQNLLRIVEIAGTNEFTKLDESRVFTPIETNALQEIQKSLNAILAIRNRMVDTNQKLFVLKAEMLNVLIRAYTDESFILSSSAEVDVTPKHGPYVSLDAGILMAYNPYRNSDGQIGNTTYFSIYEGVNVYFAPVNKRVPLSAFRWPYRFYKAFNIHFGIANFGGNYRTYRFENSFGRLGNPVVGLGLRFNSATKIGISTMFVNMRNINPTVTQSKLVPFLCANLSFDINVVGAIQRVLNRTDRTKED